MAKEGGAAPPPRTQKDKDSDEEEPVAAPEDANISGDEARSVSSDDNDNARVREKLKQTTIAAKGRAREQSSDEEMGSDAEIDRRRKRSFDDSDPEDKPGKEATRARAHERKRSREISDEDMEKKKVGWVVKTPPSVDEEMVSESVDNKVNSATEKKIERKRSRGKIDEEDVDNIDKKKISKTEEEERRKGEESKQPTTAGEGASENGRKPAEEDKESPQETKIPEGSGFGNTSAKSPFATAAANAKPLFGSGTSAFARSKFGALANSSTSPFGTLGAKSSSQSPFGAFGATSSVFGGGLSGFGAAATKSSMPAKPFGTPDDDGADSKEKDEGAKSDSEQDSPGKELGLEGEKTRDGFVEQEIMTGEEGEITLFKNQARAFAFDKAAGLWKERGRGVLKLNKTDTDDDSDPPRKKGARLVMRTEGTLTLVLNNAVYKGMSMGDIKGGPPTGTACFFVGQDDDGKPQQISLRFKNVNLAKELHKLVADLQKELFT